jgi:hypothetical protein
MVQADPPQPSLPAGLQLILDVQLAEPTLKDVAPALHQELCQHISLMACSCSWISGVPSPPWRRRSAHRSLQLTPQQHPADGHKLVLDLLLAPCPACPGGRLQSSLRPCEPAAHTSATPT